MYCWHKETHLAPQKRRLMKEHPDVYTRMVAAYVLSYSITDDYLAENPHLKFASGSGEYFPYL
ncbi:hypothetical protein SAMN06296020_12212 [Anoxynatronum buryatiense]|uniref:Uncharacterized protein n=2 Tax=Anoxynatronum TaxID=210622 RepID=A0AA45WZ30_9CLOT|nr:hypothetical protein SAMN06296020_12212 [Anoxynatronum buryatiense]